MVSKHWIRYWLVMLGMLWSVCMATAAMAAGNVYPWLPGAIPEETLAVRIAPPPGYVRDPVASGSFAGWLRYLPLKPEGSPVLLYDGSPKFNQQAHYAVIDIDRGQENLQQCADAVIRLRAEYLYSRGRGRDVHFNFTSGDRAAWSRSARADASYPAFRHYLDTVFTYAGTWSLSRELHHRPLRRMRIGDVFIRGGFPGHAVLVVDMARDVATGEKLFMLAQSYMPAQDIHILRNDIEPALSPWYRMPDVDGLVTPEWTFKTNQLKAFPDDPSPTQVSRVSHRSS